MIIEVCVSFVLLPGSARAASGEITVLLADAVIGSQGEDALRASLYSLFLELPLPKSCSRAPGSLFACLLAGCLTNLMNRLPVMRWLQV